MKPLIHLSPGARLTLERIASVLAVIVLLLLGAGFLMDSRPALGVPALIAGAGLLALLLLAALGRRA